MATMTEYESAILDAEQKCAMNLIDATHEEWQDGVKHQYEVWQCPVCEATYLYDVANIHERMCVTCMCVCGREYRFDADKGTDAEVLSVMPELISAKEAVA